jgi:IclR family KDG regulon transcriptional repressor
VVLVPYSGTLKTVQKAIELLRSFDAAHPTLGIADLSRRLGLPRSVVHRIAATLRAEGLLEQEPQTRRYRIGIGLFDLGARYTHRHRWFPLALDAMKELVASTGHAAYVGVLDGPDIVVLAAEAGAHRVRLVVKPGERFPAYATAIGKALLARLPVQAVRSLYATSALPPVTRATLRDVPALLAELARVRERRYAVADQETFVGIKAAGVGFTSAPEEERFAISISYPLAGVARQDERRIVAALLQAADRVGRALGDPWWTARLEAARR